MKNLDRLFELIGLPSNEFQVLHDFDYKSKHDTVFYPGFLISADISADRDEAEILQTLQRMVEEHLSDVNKTLRLIKTFRKTYGK